MAGSSTMTDGVDSSGLFESLDALENEQTTGTESSTSTSSTAGTTGEFEIIVSGRDNQEIAIELEHILIALTILEVALLIHLVMEVH